MTKTTKRTIPTTMGTCNRCGGKFTSGNGITEPGPYCFSPRQCDDNVAAQAKANADNWNAVNAAHNAGIPVPAATAQSAWDKLAGADEAIAEIDTLCLTEEALGRSLSRVLAARGDRPQAVNEAIDAMAHEFSAPYRMSLKRYARGETIETIRAKHGEAVMLGGLYTQGSAMERLRAALAAKGGVK